MTLIPFHIRVCDYIISTEFKITTGTNVLGGLIEIKCIYFTMINIDWVYDIVTCLSHSIYTYIAYLDINIYNIDSRLMTLMCSTLVPLNELY